MNQKKGGEYKKTMTTGTGLLTARNRPQKDAVPVQKRQEIRRRVLDFPGADGEAEDGADELASPTNTISREKTLDGMYDPV